MSVRKGRATAGHNPARSGSRSKTRPPEMGGNSPELVRPHECVKLNLVVCGSDARIKSSISEQILQQTERSDVDLYGRQISLVELPALFNSRLSEEEVMRQTLRCVSLCDPGVHVFLLIIPAGPLTNEDKAEIDKIQKIFSSIINKHIMILITQNSEQTTAELNEETKSVIESFGGRHYFYGPTTQVSTLMENVEQMVKENRGGIFSTETFLEAQMKKLQKLEKQINSLKAHFLSKESDDLRIVLLGKTGVGKSATGNTILGRDAFTAEESFQSVTSETRRETAEINGRQVTVIDTPGLFDTELTNEEIQRQITNCISLVLPGPHVFLLLIPLGRFTPEEAKSAKIIQETFGENSLMYTMVLFTRGDGLKNKTIEKCLGKPGSPLMDLIEACGNRYHVFNNNHTADRTQVSDLLEKIDNMVRVNGGSFYSCKMFRQMEREKQEQAMKILMERVEQLNKEREELVNNLKEEKERIEREKQEQLEILEKTLKEERKMREDQQKIFEEKLKLQQHEDELKRRQMKLEGYEREKEEMKNKKKKKKICSKTDDPLKVTAYRKLETEYDTWSWCLQCAMMEIENKLHNKIENETIHLVEETDLQREMKKTSEEVKRSMSEFFEKDKDKDILIQWKTSFEIKIKELQENIVRETKRKLNEILQQRDLKKKIDAQRTYNENTLYEKSKELALKLKDKATDEETLKKEFDSFWKHSVDKIIRDTPVIKDIDIMRDVSEILGDVFGSVSVDHWKVSRDIFSVQSYSEYVIFKRFPKGGIKKIVKGSLGLPQTLKNEAQIRSLVTDVAQQTDRMIQSFNIPKMGYNISCIQQLTDYIKANVMEHEKKSVKYVFKNEFFIDLVLSICTRANKMITDQHRLFREANDTVIYVDKKREEYYSIFQKYCHGATSAAIFGEIICQKLKEPIEQSVYKKTARDLADEMRTNCESLNGNRSNLEKHILKTLAEEEDFDKYMNYIHNPRDYFKSFIRDEVNRYITDKFSVSVLPKMKKNIELLQQKIMEAAHESTEHVQVSRGDVGLWLNSFTQQLSDVLIFSEKDLNGVNHDDVYDFNLLEDVIRKELPAVMSDISRINRETFDEKLDLKERPDELLIDHFCQCCWVQCPFCNTTCTNTIENHDGDHSVPFHRINGLNGWFYRGTTNLSVEICTSAVASGAYFYPNASHGKVLWRDYRKAGGVYADWSITSDLSELPYWKWFVCRFQKDLQKHYSKTFERSGEIPQEWRKYTNHDAIESLDQYI